MNKIKREGLQLSSAPISVRKTLMAYLSQDHIFGNKINWIEAFLNSLCIFSNGGFPIWVHDHRENKNGGFFVAISAFATMKMDKTDITIRGGESELTIIQSEHYIGTFQQSFHSLLPEATSIKILRDILTFLDNYRQFTRSICCLTETTMVPLAV